MNVSEETASEAFVTNKEVEDDSHWEDLAISDQSSEGNIKPLSTRDLQTVFNDIMSKFDKCQDNVKYLVSLLAILMQQVSATDGKQGGILETSPQTNCEVMQEMKRVIKNHRHSFLAKKNAFLPAESNMDSVVIRSSNVWHKRKTSKRLMPVHEKHRKRLSGHLLLYR